MPEYIKVTGHTKFGDKEFVFVGGVDEIGVHCRGPTCPPSTLRPVGAGTLGGPQRTITFSPLGMDTLGVRTVVLYFITTGCGYSWEREVSDADFVPLEAAQCGGAVRGPQTSPRSTFERRRTTHGYFWRDVPFESLISLVDRDGPLCLCSLVTGLPV